MAYENTAGINVANFYGPRDTGYAVGSEQTQESERRVRIDLTGTQLNATTVYVPNVVLPKGSLLKSAVLRVDEAFTLGGTSPTVIVGVSGTETTNGIVLTQTELQAVGSKVPASVGTGTWAPTSATGMTAAAKVGIVKGGTSPTVTAGVGKGTLVITFTCITKI